MQVFPLIPFFLNISLPPDFDVGSSGPKYIYDVDVSIRTQHNDLHKEGSADFRSTLTCIPLELTLYCYLDHFSRFGYNMDLMKPISGRDYSMMSPIHIFFDDSGITHLYIPPYQDLFFINVVRTIANQLNIGVYLPIDYIFMTNSFDAKENSYICKCVSHVNVSRSNSQAKASSNEIFEIVSIPNLDLTSSDTVMIMRSRYLERYVRTTGKYMFWSMETYWPNITVAQSHGTMKISSDSFESYNVNLINITSTLGTQTFEENIRLRLQSVKPSNDKTPSLDDIDNYLIYLTPNV